MWCSKGVLDAKSISVSNSVMFTKCSVTVRHTNAMSRQQAIMIHNDIRVTACILSFSADLSLPSKPWKIFLRRHLYSNPISNKRQYRTFSCMDEPLMSCRVKKLFVNLSWFFVGILPNFWWLSDAYVYSWFPYKFN